MITLIQLAEGPEQVEQHRAAEAKMLRARFFGYHPPRDKEHHLARGKLWDLANFCKSNYMARYQDAITCSGAAATAAANQFVKKDPRRQLKGRTSLVLCNLRGLDEFAISRFA